MRWLKATSGFLVLVLLLSGCLKYDATVQIDDDGSGTVDVLTALDEEALSDLLGELAAGAGDLCSEFESGFTEADLPLDAVITPYDSDGFCGSRVQYSLAPSLDHSSTLSDSLDETSFFETDFNTDELTQSAEGFDAGIVDQLFGDASFRLTIDLPGRAVAGENNATSVGDDGKFVWDLDLANPPARLFAQTEPGSGGGESGGGGFSKIIIGLLVLAALAAVAFVLLKNRSRGATDVVTGADGVPFTAPSQAAMPGDHLAAASAPPIDADPVVDRFEAGANPVMPVSEAAKETVVMQPQEAHRLAAEAAAEAKSEVTDDATAAADSVAEATSPSPQPVYDEALGAWVIDDPARGRLRHDTATDTWLPI